VATTKVTKNNREYTPMDANWIHLFAENNREGTSFQQIGPRAQMKGETIDFPVLKVGLNSPNIQIRLRRDRLKVWVSLLAVNNHENARCTVGIECS
jgi:hypothetical protein